ncbi:hypothetical protein CHUAL_009823 [Chamberlinius hualienensis]
MFPSFPPPSLVLTSGFASMITGLALKNHMATKENDRLYECAVSAALNPIMGLSDVHFLQECLAKHKLKESAYASNHMLCFGFALVLLFFFLLLYVLFISSAFTPSLP